MAAAPAGRSRDDEQASGKWWRRPEEELGRKAVGPAAIAEEAWRRRSAGGRHGPGHGERRWQGGARPWRCSASALRRRRGERASARGSSGARLWRSRSATVVGPTAAARGNGGGELPHGCHALDTRRPLRNSTEHVAGSKAISVGSRFGPFAGQIWTWAQKQSCSPHNALQFLFKVHCHKGYGLAINCAPK